MRRGRRGDDSGVTASPAVPILTPDQRPRVFISSTLVELTAERAAARAAVEALRLIPVMFELGARPHPARALYRAYLAQSHVFVAVYAERYGWVAPGEEVSGLEDEYLLSAGLPRLVYVKTPAPAREPRLAALLARVRDDDTVSYKSFTDAAELGALLRDDLAVLLGERFLLGGAVGAPEPHPAPAPAPALPYPMTELIGRDDQVAAVSRLLATGERMVTLVGPGGIGKTRVALEVAHRLAAEGRDPVAFVPLEAVVDPGAVLPAVAAALGVGLDGGIPAMDALVAALGPRRFVLVVDNLEQVAAAASDLAGLLERCPGVAVLATSRAPLRLRGERQVPVEPLGLPDPDDMGAAVHAPAVALFLDRARAVQPGFGLDRAEDVAAVAELVRRLDGIPLALEMAAARARLLSPTALLNRVGSALDLGSRAGDVPARQRTVRDTLSWSEQLLSPEQRCLLARLSLFVAPWTLTDAESVGGADLGDAFEGVAALVESSLAVPAPGTVGEPRFRLYETVRAFAAERLTGPERVAAEQRYVRRLASVTEALDRGIRSADHARWRTEFRLLWPDLRLAWGLALRDGDATTAVHFVNAWVGLWLDGRLHEAEELMAGTLAAAAGQHPPRHGDLVLAAAGWAFNRGDYARARELIEQLGREVPVPEIPEAAGTVCLYRGYLDAGDGAFDAAAEQLARSTALLADAGAGGRWIEAFAHSGLGSLAALGGDLETARREHSVSGALGREYGNVAAEMQAAVFLAVLGLATGDLAEARELLASASDLVEQHPFYEGNAYCLEAAAAVAVADGDAVAAARALGVARALRDVIGARVWPLLEPVSAQVQDGVRAALDPTAFAAAFAAGRATDPRRAAALARDLVRPATGTP